ncbi:MAG: hypothetical protein F6K32_01205 [Desertifilum sp. SIO1I2]|nr:hypothetical protein [Desertifilum sp. SIO1I2]
MPQNVSPSRITSDLPEDPISLQPWSMETNADSLMNELFAEIDHVLEGGTALPTEPVQPEYVSLKPLEIQSIRLPSTLTPISVEAPVVPSEAVEVPAPVPQPEAAPVPATVLQQELPPSRSSTLDRVLLLALGAAIAVPLILWAATQGRFEPLKRWQLAVAPAPVEPVSPQVEANANSQFANYMQRSLELIDRQAATATATPNPTANPAPVSEDSNQAQASNRVPTVLERVYIPVYQPPPPAPPPTVAAAPAAPAAPAPPVAPPTVAVMPAPPPPPSLPNVAVAPSPALPPIPEQVHTLVGVLELGDRSAALFEVEGATRRVGIGEQIGNGWTIVEIANQEAVIRRNGEVRSVYVGQKF